MTIGVSADGALSPSFRRSRSVGQVGRKSETTLRITSFNLEIGALAGPAAEQFQLPSRPAYARHRERVGRQRAHSPAGYRCGRLAKISRFGLPSPSSYGDADSL
jgi:hypothetical protein